MAKVGVRHLGRDGQNEKMAFGAAFESALTTVAKYELRIDLGWGWGVGLTPVPILPMDPIVDCYGLLWTDDGLTMD